MIRHGYAVAFFAGLLLLLAAGALLLAPPQAAGHATTEQRLRVQDAIAELGPCLTCHTEKATPAQLDTALIAHSAADATASEPDALLAQAPPFIESTTETLKRQLDRELYDVGQRLLELPESESEPEQYAALLGDYLRVYDATRGASEPYLLSSMRLLEGIDRELLALEAATDPVKLARDTHAGPECSPTAQHAVPPPAPVAGGIRLAVAEVRVAPPVPVEAAPAFVPAVSVTLVHRRGPPSGVSMVESV